MSIELSGVLHFVKDEDFSVFVLGEEVKVQTNQNETLCGILINMSENSLKLKRKSGNSENIDFSDIVDIWR